MPVGFDIGNNTCFVAVARQGGIETIDNEYSARSTPTFLSFNEKSRSIGVSAKNQQITNLKNTVSTFKRFIGRKFSDPFVQQELENFPKPFKVERGKKDEILIKVQYLENEYQFTPEQMMASLLTKLKQISEAGLKTKVVDVVVSVPTYFTDIERRAMLNACEVAGLNCMKVMNDTTAAALGYGIYKQDLPAESEKPRNVVFVDMGYCSTQVAVVAFHKTKLKVLATTFDPCLGGRDFDKVLSEHFAKDFKERYKIDASKNMKARLRLETECEKLKKLMSANTQAIPINIECFMEDKDVTGRLDRTKFEELASGLFQRLETVLKSILDESKLSTSDIAAVEIVGGSSRVPAVKALVQKVFGMEPSTTLNADEAVARGCSLQNAILSPTFRVRDFSINDAQPYSITLSWQATMEEDRMNTIDRIKQSGRDQPYNTPLKAKVIKITDTRRYQNDGKSRNVTNLGLADSTGSILAVCYDETKLTSIVEGHDIMLRNYIFREKKIIITSQTVVSRTAAVGPLPNSVMETARIAVVPQDSPMKTVAEVKTAGIGQVVSVQARMVRVEEKSERTLQRSNQKVDFRSVTLKDKTEEISLSLWRNFADQELLVGRTYNIFNVKTGFYNQKVLLNNTFNTRLEVIETPVTTSTFVVEAYTIEDAFVSLVCRSPNTEDYTDFKARKEDIIALVGEDDDLDTLLVDMLPLEVNITAKENDANVISITV